MRDHVTQRYIPIQKGVEFTEKVPSKHVPDLDPTKRAGGEHQNFTVVLCETGRGGFVFTPFPKSFKLVQSAEIKINGLSNCYTEVFSRQTLLGQEYPLRTSARI